MQQALVVLACFAGLLIPTRVRAFALLGPLAPWMDQAKSYRLAGDIGGPMNIGEGYRWNIPVVTYGFDRSFLNYFGSNGVNAVEGAFGMLNQLPSASLIDPNNYPSEAWHYNYQAQALSLLDLRSTVLSLLLEQMGLANPERYVWCIRDYVHSGGSSYAFLVVRRNFDALTATPSSYVNDTLLSYYITQQATSPPPTGVFCEAVEFPVDPLATFHSTVAGFGPGTGSYATALSRDDVGGLKYLLDESQIRFESLLADIHETGATTNLVRAAFRPGIGKVTFVRHPYVALTGSFVPFTNRWTDAYYVGVAPSYQAVERVTTSPDVLFTARDLGWQFVSERTGTTNWANNAGLNGNAGGAGPGVIQPPIQIALNNVGPLYANFPPFNLDESTGVLMQAWGSFDGSTNQPIAYPASYVAFQPSLVRFKLAVAGRTNEFRWFLSGAPHGRFEFQTSTNLVTWNPLAPLTNSGAEFHYTFYALTNEPSRFFRTTPE